MGTILTARISSRDADRFDVTRKSGSEPFAPSWALLLEALGKLRCAANEAERAEAFAWYVPRYIGEMRTSYRRNRAAWDALLARPRVVLVCYCVDPEHCHRTILARDILPKLGATYGGETR